MNDFEKKETKIQRYYISAVVLMFIFYACKLVNPGKSNFQYLLYLNSGLLIDVAVVAGLNYSYFTAIPLIKKYHYKRFREIKVQVQFFYLIETIPLTVSFALELTAIIFPTINNVVDQINTVVWCIYPILQAYGMMRLKESKDPLGGISKLD